MITHTRDPLCYIVRAILARAVRDARSRGRSPRATSMRCEARAWLLSERCAKLCDLAGEDVRKWQYAAGIRTTPYTGTVFEAFGVDSVEAA